MHVTHTTPSLCSNFHSHSRTYRVRYVFTFISSCDAWMVAVNRRHALGIIFKAKWSWGAQGKRVLVIWRAIIKPWFWQASARHATAALPEFVGETWHWCCLYAWCHALRPHINHVASICKSRAWRNQDKELISYLSLRQPSDLTQMIYTLEFGFTYI